jgi:serine/threonine-protein kinase
MTDIGATGSAASLPPHVGGTLGRYRLEAELGRGGMGVVFRGRDELLQRSAAVKVLSAGLAGDEQFRLRFLREMRLASALEHPNVVPVYEAGLEGEHLYLATRFVDGEDLRDTIHRLGGLAAPRVADIAMQLAGALDAAHAHGLVHRDVKPANVLLSTGGEQAFLTDFGLAREAASETGLTNTGQWMGTVDYVAPEQIEGGGLVSARSDIYSMACLLYEALTGRVPYEGGLARKFAGHVTEPLPSVGPQIPRWPAIDAVLRRAAAKDPADRHPSAAISAAPSPPPCAASG